MSNSYDQLLKIAEDLGLGEFSYKKNLKKSYVFGGRGFTAESLQDFIKAGFFNVSQEDQALARTFIEGRDGLKTLTKVLETGAKKSLPNAPLEYAGLVLYEDPTDPTEMPYFLVDPKTSQLSQIYPGVYIRDFKKLRDVDITIGAPKAIRRYDPRAPVGAFTTTETLELHGTPFFNTYVPPQWMKSVDQVPAKPPEDFLKFITHLIPDDLDRKYLVHWIRGSLLGRCPTFLVMCGKGGVGKTTFKELMRGLHGFRNTNDGKKSMLTDKFNKGLTDTTLIVFDELQWSAKEEAVLKEMPNKSVSIEAKGVDATRQTKIHASYMIMNNNARDNYIDPDGRKFVPLGVAKVNLETIMSGPEIDAFVSKFESDTMDIGYLAQVAKWIIDEGDASDLWPNYEYKGRQFYWLAQVCMTQWQKKIMETLLATEKDKRVKDAYVDGKGYLWSDLHAFFVKGKSAFAFTNGRGVDYETVKNFFERYRDLTGSKIFAVVPKGGNGYETISSDFYVEIVAEPKLDPDEVDPEIDHGDVTDSDLTTKFKLTAIINDEDELSDEDFL